MRGDDVRRGDGDGKENSFCRLRFRFFYSFSYGLNINSIINPVNIFSVRDYLKNCAIGQAKISIIELYCHQRPIPSKEKRRPDPLWVGTPFSYY
jgi:hypothetical protein